MLKVIIIGATSGIGRELARVYAAAGHLVGATGRRQDLLYSLQLEYPNLIVTECWDVTDGHSKPHLDSLVNKLGGLDLLIYNAGYGAVSGTLDLALDKTMVDIQVNGFLEAIHYGWDHFIGQGSGHLAVTSSIASIRGNGRAPAYSACKAFESVYFEGLQIKTRAMKIPLYVTDIQPGFVDTKMAGGRFWIAPVGKAAKQIVRAIEKKKWRVYITRRWWLVAKVFKWIPDWVYHRMG